MSPIPCSWLSQYIRLLLFFLISSLKGDTTGTVARNDASRFTKPYQRLISVIVFFSGMLNDFMVDSLSSMGPFSLSHIVNVFFRMRYFSGVIYSSHFWVVVELGTLLPSWWTIRGPGCCCTWEVWRAHLTPLITFHSWSCWESGSTPHCCSHFNHSTVILFCSFGYTHFSLLRCLR